MSRPRKCDIKPDFLSFIDLLYRCRKEEIGRTGRTRIKLEELQPLLISSRKLNRFVEQLVDDGVIKMPTELIEYEMTDDQTLRQTNGYEEIELWSNYTKEQIIEYRHSLTRTESQHTVFNAPSWEAVSLQLVDAANLTVSIQGTDTLDVPVTNKTLGFVNSRNNHPNKAWEFLLILILHGGSIDNRHQKLLASFGSPSNIDKRKQEVKQGLQDAFNLTDIDPFEPLTRSNRAYTLKCHVGTSENLTIPNEATRNDFEHEYEQEMNRFS